MKQQTILITGAKGFIGSNLVIRMAEDPNIHILKFVRGDNIKKLDELVVRSNAVIHLAGENRTDNISDYARNNTDLTKALCDSIQNTKKNIPLIYVSSIQAKLENPYGKSKLAAEKLIEKFAIKTSNSCTIYRLVGVFGKFCKPNYNSVVATFCHNIARDIPIKINDPDLRLELAYIDDVVEELLNVIKNTKPGLSWGNIDKTYHITLGELAEQIAKFNNCRSSLIIERVGSGLTRALYSTYISYLPIKKFTYDLTFHEDDRGIFVEMLKTSDCGQFSFFTIAPGITRGSHYHHTKTEKFLVVNGKVRIRYRHLISDKIIEIELSSERPQVIDTIPGWVHDVTNIGQSDAVVMLWANEIFDPHNPDCFPCEV